MGMTTAKIRNANNTDFQMALAGRTSTEAVRSMEVEAIADTGSITLALPRSLIERLGVPVEGTAEATVADGRRIRVGRAHGVRIDLMDRTTVVTAYVTEGDGPVLLGAIPLEDLDLHVDPKTRRVVPNHPEGQVGILYGAVA